MTQVTHSYYCHLASCHKTSLRLRTHKQVKKGTVLSPVLFCVYKDDLLLSLSKAGVDCYIGFNFVGALAYADDIVLIAPKATVLSKLLIICNEYARDNSISFNAIKTKCLVVVPCRRCALFEEHACQNACFKLASLLSHSDIGYLINSELSDHKDITKGRNNFIGQVNNTLRYFRSLDSLVQNKLFRSYCTSYYGCELWLLNNPK